MTRPLLQRLRPSVLVAAALVAFAGNSLLCRAALAAGRTDPATFTLVRIGSGALVLGALAGRRGRLAYPADGVAWVRAAALFAYAALFSWAYVRVEAGVGALTLIGFVQLSMIGWAALAGSPPRRSQGPGIAVALGGLGLLTLPGARAPDSVGLLLMAGSGVAWGTYSLLGRRAGAPLLATARAFAGAVPLALAALAVSALSVGLRAHPAGLALALASGAVTSGLGYVVWYAALPSLDAVRAAVVQLALPVLAALGGVFLLGEAPTLRLAVSSAAVLGGIAWVVLASGGRREPSPSAGRRYLARR